MTSEKLNIDGRVLLLRTGLNCGLSAIKSIRGVVREEVLGLRVENLAAKARNVRHSSLNTEQQTFLESTRAYVQEHRVFEQEFGRDGFTVLHMPTLPDVNPLTAEFDVAATIMSKESKLIARAGIKFAKESLELGSRFLLAAARGEIDVQEFEERFIPSQFRIPPTE